MAENNGKVAVEALSIVISTLSRLDDESRRRVLQSVTTFFDYNADANSISSPTRVFVPEQQSEGLRGLNFSIDNAPSPKAFLMEKQPRTDVERVACLAYYLTHFRDTPHFKTLDIGKLNTEAAQPKFSNTAYASNNAMKMGYLAPAAKGQRQLSAAGELFVSALPDRDAARTAMEQARPRRRPQKKK